MWRDMKAERRGRIAGIVGLIFLIIILGFFIFGWRNLGVSEWLEEANKSMSNQIMIYESTEDNTTILFDWYDRSQILMLRIGERYELSPGTSVTRVEKGYIYESWPEDKDSGVSCYIRHF